MAEQVKKPDHLIDLGIGQPDPELLPVSLFQSMRSRWQDLAYGEETGDASFRQTLGQWLSGEYGCRVDPGNLLITNGSSNALDMICTRLAGPGDTVVVEDPSYFIALNQLADHGLQVVSVAMDEHGMDPAALETALQRHRPAFIYTIPSFHNPTGITQPDRRRRALVALARQYQCPLVADEVYQCLYYDRRPPPPLACYDHEAPVLSVGSFSKILAPGLRLGWIQGAGSPLQTLVDAALLKSGGGLAPVTSAIVGPLIDSGEFQQYLATLRHTYGHRRDVLYQSLQSHSGERLGIIKPEGGYFLWVQVNGLDTASRLDRAREVGVNYLGGSLFSPGKGCASNMRLCFAWYPEDDLASAGEKLARLMES